MSRPKKTILITGASSGIGEALALSYASEGHHLLLTGTNKPRLDDVQQRCIEKGASVHSKVMDVRDREAMDRWLCKEDEKTPIDLVIANAGISAGTVGLDEKHFMSQIRAIYDVNVIGVLNTIEPVLNKMIERKSGQVAFMSSMASYAPWSGAPAYASSKTAMRYLGHALRSALRPYNIKVNVICPGFVESRITAKNNFPMPFLKKADYAAEKIKNGLEKDKMTIAFPIPVYIISAVMGVVPHIFLSYITSKLPKKTA